MTKDEIVRGNLDLLSEFMRYAFEHPEILDEIPRGAEVVILPENDPELYRENFRMLEDRQGQGMPCAVFRMERPKPAVPCLEHVVV